MTDWLHTLQRVGERGLDAVLVTVTSGQGSTPRDAGAKMLVTVDGIHGTVGGGELEFQATEVARSLLRATGGKEGRRFPLGADLGQFCGGAANLIFERIPPGVEWVQLLAEWQQAGEACVLATSATGEGRMLVRANAAWGSLGSDAADAAVLETARRLLAQGEDAPRLVTLDDGAAVLLEPLRPSDFHVVLFGAGTSGARSCACWARCRAGWPGWTLARPSFRARCPTTSASRSPTRRSARSRPLAPGATFW